MHFADFFAGSFGGACGVAVGYPLDTVKVRIQTQKQFAGIWHCIVTTIKKEGVSVMSPGDLVKVRLQCQTESKRSGLKPRYSGPMHCLLSVARDEGISGLYRGALPLAFRDGPSFATYFLTYSTLCSLLTPAGQKETGTAGWSVGTPMDVIKARLQMDGVRGERRYRGLVHCVTETIRNEGPGIFFRSLGINCLRAFPVNMVVFAVYEVSVRVLSLLYICDPLCENLIMS
ncbi:hypothetical protein cypCar_00042987 [Cyprinus carpio]|nr:hypothetical protein cypCar_00042987 [Cyprinus carpio]